MLKIAKNLDLPLDFVTERLAFLARTGAGKSGGMRVFFEQYLTAGQFCVFVDPKGDAWGIRAAGKGAGYPVLVMGGDHGDVPLESTAGSVVAEFLVRERVSTVLDISDFGTQEMVRFITDLATTLYKRNRDVMHLFLDEADMVAGEKFFDPKCLHAIQLIQNKGRHRGFGVTVATQRSAMINKTVLFASGTLVAMQTTGPKDIKAVREWLEVCATAEATREILQALPTLEPREAFIYSPQRLGAAPQRIRFAEFRTFDSMRTPKPGEARQQPKRLADVDLAAIQRDMARSIEELKANDPKLLKKRIGELASEVSRLEKRAAAAPSAKPEIKRVEVPVVTDRQIERLAGTAERVQELSGKLMAGLADVVEALNKIEAARLDSKGPHALRDVTHVTVRGPVPATARGHVLGIAASNGSGVEGERPLGKAERALLTAICQYHPQLVDKPRLSLHSGYSIKSSSFSNAISALRSLGLIAGSGELQATPAGLELLGDVDPLPTGEALQAYWLGRLGKAEAALLRALIEAYPSWLDKPALSEATGYSASSSSFSNALSRLRSLKLASGSREMVASEILFGD